DESYFKEMVKKEKTIEKYREDYINKTEVTDEEAKKFFDENKDAYEVVKASHILVETEEEAKNILERIEKGEDFKALAKEKSKDEGSAKEGGDLGYFTKDKMVPEFSKVAFSLKPGEVSEVVKSQHGYHIIKVEDKIDKYDKANDEMKDEIVQGIKVTRFQEHLEKMRDEAKVDIYTEENKKSEDKSDDKKDNEKKEDKKAS
ncbi:peptidylprolyl isomerase, partial [Anaerosalibacter bizertensis]|nr:peptidylprolyl isomerase [Anaerosalibacter bizertensis]